MNCMPWGAYHICGYCQGADFSTHWPVFLLNDLSECYLKCGLTNTALELYPRKKFIMANNHETVWRTLSKEGFRDPECHFFIQRRLRGE